MSTPPDDRLTCPGVELRESAASFAHGPRAAETACRRGGALGLRVMDLDVDRGLVRLSEKGGTLRWQPITLDLATCLAEHAQARGAHLPGDGLLRFRRGTRLTYRRFDHYRLRLLLHCGTEWPTITTPRIEGAVPASWRRAGNESNES